jgi:hypothetical protein
MRIEVTDAKPPFHRPPFDCQATVEVGGIRYNVGPSTLSELREDALGLARGLQERKPFAPEFGCEPLFNVSFEGEQFVTFLYRPRLGPGFAWLPRWLIGRKVVSRPESVAEATDYLNRFAAG